MAKAGVFTGGEQIPIGELNETIEQRARELADSPELSLNLDEDGDADELRALAELDSGGDVKFQVWRLLPFDKDHPKGFVCELMSAELTIAKVQEDCGPGRYRIRGIRSNGTYAGQRTIDISPPPKSGPVAVAGAASGQPSSMADVLMLIETQNERRRQEDKERSENMLKWAGVLTPVLAPVLAGLFQKGPSLAELTTSLANLKELQGGNDSQLSRIEEFSKMVEVVRGMTGEEKTGSTWVDLIRDGIKEAGPVITGLVAQRGGTLPANPPANAPPLPLQPPPNPPAQNVKQGDPMLQLMGWLKDQLNGLTHQASLNKDPSLYAEVVLDNMPAGVDPKLLQTFLARPDWWAALTQFYPQAQSYPAWFAECRGELLKGLNEMIRAVETPAASPAAPSAMPHDTDEHHE